MDNIIGVFEGMACVRAGRSCRKEWRGGLRVGRLMGWAYQVESAAGRGIREKKKQEGLSMAGREPRALSPPVKTCCGYSGAAIACFWKRANDRDSSSRSPVMFWNGAPSTSAWTLPAAD